MASFGPSGNDYIEGGAGRDGIWSADGNDINTTLSNLEYNSDRRPTADVKSGPEETPTPSRDRFQWLA
jgi:Ca2+-binding RTX toxin-like protein